MIFSKNGNRDSAEATLAVVAVGWVANTAALNLAVAGVETDHRGFRAVDEYLRTSTRCISSPLETLPVARCWSRQRFRMASSRQPMPCEDRDDVGDQVNPIGSFTDPEYAQVGPDRGKGP